MKRRQFLNSAAAAAVLSSHFVHGKKSVRVDQLTTESSSEGAASRIPRVSTAGTMRGEMLYRDLGSTGIQVSVIGLGGSHLGQANVTEDEAVRLIHEGLDRGINFWTIRGITTRDEVKNRWEKRSPRRLQTEGLRHDQNRRAHKGSCDEPDR